MLGLYKYIIGSAIGAGFMGIVFFGGVACLLYDPNIPNYYYSQRYADAINTAVQTGRLDAVTLVLAILSLIIAIFGLVGFGYIKHKSHEIAEETAREVAKQAVEKWIEERAPGIIYAWCEEIGEIDGLDGSDADRISMSVDPEPVNDEGK